MKRLAVLPSALAFAATLALPAAAERPDDALALVPADAASVGVIHVADLRTSPLAARLFSDTDHVCVGGDAQHFLDEARLNPKEDVDLVVAAGSPKGAGGSDGWGLVLFEGRFDPARLSAALVERGATKKSTPAGDYYLVPDRHADASGHGGGPAAIAFASKRPRDRGLRARRRQRRSRSGAPEAPASPRARASAVTSPASTRAPRPGRSWTSRAFRRRTPRCDTRRRRPRGERRRDRRSCRP